tara:strand:+ start:16960 stop:17376 length:417 start_codon:yes stop_codon:yes gene_type:complete
MSTIALTPHSNHVRGELKAGASGIVPGHLVDIVNGTYRVHSSAVTACAKMFALEKISTAGDIDEGYISGETVFVGSFPAGERVNALLKSGETVTDGALVTSGGNGTLVATGATVTNAIGYSRSSLTASGSTRIVVELI